MLLNKAAHLKTALCCSRYLLFLLRKLVSHGTLYIMIFLLNSSSEMSEYRSKIEYNHIFLTLHYLCLICTYISSNMNFFLLGVSGHHLVRATLLVLPFHPHTAAGWFSTLKPVAPLMGPDLPLRRVSPVHSDPSASGLVHFGPESEPRHAVECWLATLLACISNVISCRAKLTTYTNKCFPITY